MPTRTDKVPNTSATAASCGSDLNGAAVRDACDTLRDAPRRRRRGDARRAGRRRRVRRRPRRRQRPGRARRCRSARSWPRPTTSACRCSRPASTRRPDIHFDWKTGQGKPFHYFAYGAAVSEVEVDGFTGQYRLLRTDILHDVGDSLSPLVDRGQVEGGFVQGVGWLTTEELVWGGDGALPVARRVDLQAADARRVPARSARRVPRARRASPASSTAARRSASRR